MRYDEIEEYSNQEPYEERETDGLKSHRCHVPPMKINCALEVAIENKNKIIEVCPGKLQYFTAHAICCSGGEEIEIIYCGENTKCICNEVVICGCLGFYKIVKSGIVFIPHHKLSEMHEEWFPTDILCFKAKEKCGKVVKEVIFDVVFTFSRCTNCERNCSGHCKS